MNQPFTTLLTSKYIPSSQQADIILNYFVCNNFQDFNTWQQIAKTKLEYEYTENQKNIFLCTVTLKWDERILPTIIQQAEAKNKRDSKKRALKKLIQNIIYQGYIANGFKQEKFIQKLPKRRKSSSDQSEEETDDIKNSQKMILRELLQAQKEDQALNLLNDLRLKRKQCEIIQCWIHGLRERSKDFLKKILEIIMNKEISLQEKRENEYNPSQNQVSSQTKQFFYGHEVKNLLQEDLTDFIRYFQIQKQSKQHKVIRSADLKIRMIPSEKVLAVAKSSVSPSRQQLALHFHPIEGRKLFFIKQGSRGEKSEEYDLPKFQQQKSELSLSLLEGMYNLLLFMCQDYNFIEEIVSLLQEIKNVKIQFDPILKYSLHHKGQQYYLLNKPLLVCQFTYILSNKLNNSHRNANIEGILINYRPEDHFFFFNYKEEEEIINKKISRRNFNEFYQMNEISLNQLVILVSKTEKERILIGQIKEFTQPQIKIYVPMMKTLTQHESFTIYRLYNTKIYDKSSSAIIKTAKRDVEIIQEHTSLIWQPPTYPRITIISELIIEWLTIKSTILIISMNCDILNNELTSLGFKTLKITPKIDDKLLIKMNIVVAAPNTVCCDLLKNYVFDRVLVDNAHQISEILSVLSIVKGCKKLYLLGDPFLPRMEVSNPFCRQRGMGVSLFERLYREGQSSQTFTSHIECKYLYKNVMQWANIYLYSSKLMLYDQEKPTSLIKGFPWPSINQRICFIHHQYSTNQQAYLSEQAFICSAICAQIYKSGYTTLQEIACSIVSLKDYLYLSKAMVKLLQQLKITDPKIIAKKLQRLCKVIKGSMYMHSELSILMLGLNYKQTTFRQLLGALYEGRRGVIIIGDMSLFSVDQDCANFLDWCISNKLLCKVQFGCA